MRLDRMELTGCPDDNSLLRCAIGLYNKKLTREIGSIYDCLNNVEYPVGRFEYRNVYSFLARQTTILEAVSCGSAQEMAGKGLEAVAGGAVVEGAAGSVVVPDPAAGDH
jgi:hypothetical protein